MGSCCGKGSNYSTRGSDEPSAWQLATMDDFYDSEAGDMHDEDHVVELQPSSVHISNGEGGKLDLDHPIYEDQYVSLDFNLAPRRPTLNRSSILLSSTNPSGSSRESTEALVLPELAAMNDLRGSGSFTMSSRSSPQVSHSNLPVTRVKVTSAAEASQGSSNEANIDQTVIVRNSESVYSYTYGEASDTANGQNKSLGGMLSGEDDEDSVALPLVSSPQAKTSPELASRPSTLATPSSPAKTMKQSSDGRYVALGSNDDSTIYEDALSSEQTSLAT
jgi:hypothetical protein